MSVEVLQDLTPYMEVNGTIEVKTMHFVWEGEEYGMYWSKQMITDPLSPQKTNGFGWEINKIKKK